MNDALDSIASARGWPSTPVPGPHDSLGVDLVVVELDATPDVVRDARRLLGREELARAQRFASRCLQHRYIAARAALRTILAAHAGLRPEELRFAAEANGKPTLKNACGLHFNLAHSEGVAVIAVALDREVGVDLESVDPTADNGIVVQHVCTPAELAAIRNPQGLVDPNAFLTVWVAKEAYLKATGEGLTADPRSVETARMLDSGMCEVSGHRIFGFRFRSFVGAVAAAVQPYQPPSHRRHPRGWT